MPATQVIARRMTMPEIRAKARELGLSPGRMKKADLVRAIQVAEHNTPCYGTSRGDCPYVDCCFRAGCFKVGS